MKTLQRGTTDQEELFRRRWRYLEQDRDRHIWDHNSSLKCKETIQHSRDARSLLEAKTYLAIFEVVGIYYILGREGWNWRKCVEGGNKKSPEAQFKVNYELCAVSWHLSAALIIRQLWPHQAPLQYKTKVNN